MHTILHCHSYCFLDSFSWWPFDDILNQIEILCDKIFPILQRTNHLSEYKHSNLKVVKIILAKCKHAVLPFLTRTYFTDTSLFGNRKNYSSCQISKNLSKMLQPIHILCLRQPCVLSNFQHHKFVSKQISWKFVGKSNLNVPIFFSFTQLPSASITTFHILIYNICMLPLNKLNIVHSELTSISTTFANCLCNSNKQS